MRALVLIAVMLAGCSTPKPVYLANGKQGYSIDCSGTVRTWGQCMEKAGQVCGARGFDVLSQDGGNSHIVNTFGGNNQVIPTASRTMLIACR
jgi:hypothetical protein